MKTVSMKNIFMHSNETSKLENNQKIVFKSEIKDLTN